MLLASEHGAIKTKGEMIFLFGDWYRNKLMNRRDPSTLTTQQWSRDFYGWALDPRETIGIPYTDVDSGVPLVELIADMLLWVK